MKTMSNKSTHEQQVQAFIANGGKIIKFPTNHKPRKTREVNVVEINLDALPKELLRLIK